MIKTLKLKLRLEEVVALVFLIPIAMLTIAANIYFTSMGDIPEYVSSSLRNLVYATVFFLIIYIAAIFKDRSKFTRLVRDVLPFCLVIAVYINLRNIIAFLNMPDISSALIKIDTARPGPPV